MFVRVVVKLGGKSRSVLDERCGAVRCAGSD